MSYKSLKRLLGETSLERKCRFLLGGGIVLLITLSFWVYARQTESLAYDQTVTSGRLLVPPILAREHLDKARKAAIDEFQATADAGWPGTVGEYKYRIIVPAGRDPRFAAEGEEIGIVNRFAANPDLAEDSRSLKDQGALLLRGRPRPRVVPGVPQRPARRPRVRRAARRRRPHGGRLASASRPGPSRPASRPTGPS